MGIALITFSGFAESINSFTLGTIGQSNKGSKPAAINN